MSKPKRDGIPWKRLNAAQKAEVRRDFPKWTDEQLDGLYFEKKEGKWSGLDYGALHKMFSL